MSEPATPTTDPATPPTEPPAAPAEPSTPPPAATDSAFIGPDNAINYDVAGDHLPPELRGSIDGFKERLPTVPDLFKAYKEAETELTRVKQAAAEVPKEATLDAYGIQRPDGIDDETWKSQEEFMQPYVEIAHQGGMSKEAFGELVNHFNEQATQSIEAQQTADREAKDAARNQLLEAWGDEFNARLETTQRHTEAVLNSLDIPVDSKEAEALMNNSAFIQIMHRMAPREGSAAVPAGASTPVSKAEQGEAIMTDPNHPLHQKFLDESRQGGGPTIDYVESLRKGMTRPRGL